MSYFESDKKKLEVLQILMGACARHKVMPPPEFFEDFAGAVGIFDKEDTSTTYRTTIATIPGFMGVCNKIMAIKEVRTLTGLGLADAKQFVEGNLSHSLPLSLSRAIDTKIQPHGYKVT